MTACWAGVKTAWFVVGACPVGAGDPVVDMGVGRCPTSGGAGVAVAIGSSGPVCARGASLAMGVSIVAGASVVILECARGAALAMGMSRGVGAAVVWGLGDNSALFRSARRMSICRCCSIAWLVAVVLSSPMSGGVSSDRGLSWFCSCWRLVVLALAAARPLPQAFGVRVVAARDLVTEPSYVVASAGVSSFSLEMLDICQGDVVARSVLCCVLCLVVLSSFSCVGAKKCKVSLRGLPRVCLVGVLLIIHNVVGVVGLSDVT